MLLKKLWLLEEIFVPKHSTGSTRTPPCVRGAHIPHTAGKWATPLNCFGTREVWARGPAKQKDSSKHMDILRCYWASVPLLISQSLHHMLPKKGVFPALHFLTAQGADPTETGQREDNSPSAGTWITIISVILWSLCLLQSESRASERTSRPCPCPHVPLFSINST